MAHALVTGASGFIGYHLVHELTNQGHDVTCFVRSTARLDRLERLRPRFAFGDVADSESVRRALDGVDVVYHLAGTTKSLTQRRFKEVNDTGVWNVAQCCAHLSHTPVLMLVSSLAAAGPARGSAPRVETDEPDPVSNYGKSKLAGESAVTQFANSVPLTIIRPPIVLGEGDRDGLELFAGIAKFGVHLVPGLKDHLTSVVHAEDLSIAMSLLANQGERVDPRGDSSSGIYFIADNETPTYANLGRMIGKAIGVAKVRVIRVPGAAVWGVASVNEAIAQLRRRPHILNLDKAREATAGAWYVSASKLNRHTGFQPQHSLAWRLSQTVRWYVDHGWLPTKTRLQQQTNQSANWRKNRQRENV